MDAGINNTTTSYDLMLIMRTFTSPLPPTCATSSSRTTQRRHPHHPPDLAQRNDGIPTTLPISHDAALVFPPEHAPHALVVLTR